LKTLNRPRATNRLTLEAPRMGSERKEGRCLRYNADCPTCRALRSPVEVEQTRRGGEWRIRLEGRTLAHAKCRADADQLARLLRKGLDANAR
jgi:hypothetical protein